MTGRDRTAEFISTIKSKREKPQWIQQRQAANGVVDNQAVNRLAVDQHYREFMRVSQLCSHRIRDSYEKLERFTDLVRRKTVFDDGEVNRLVGDIRADITESKSQLDQLQSRYAPKEKHTENIVSTLQQRLADVTSDFRDKLEMRSKNVKQQSARQGLYAAAPSTSSMSNSLVQSNDGYGPNGPVLIDMGAGASQNNHYNDQHYHPHQQQQQLLMNDQVDLSDRADKMHLIESTIVELGTVFNQLATMVQAQGETIQRIDMNISETTGNVEAAHDALLRYFASINSNRWLILKVFGVLFFFFVVFVIFAT